MKLGFRNNLNKKITMSSGDNLYNKTRTAWFDEEEETEKWEKKYGPGWKQVGVTDPCFIKH